jgi:hypothetical protein
MDVSMGNVYLIDGDKTTLLGTGPTTVEWQSSAQETSAPIYNLSGYPSMEFTLNTIDVGVFNKAFGLTPSNQFTLEHSIPIMIQARWHKKSRVRKKWLKRFGMKQDTIKVKADCTELAYNPYDGCGNFEFEANNYTYILRPDQQRRGIAIEW